MKHFMNFWIYSLLEKRKESKRIMLKNHKIRFNSKHELLSLRNICPTTLSSKICGLQCYWIHNTASYLHQSACCHRFQSLPALHILGLQSVARPYLRCEAQTMPSWLSFKQATSWRQKVRRRNGRISCSIKSSTINLLTKEVLTTSSLSHWHLKQLGRT